MFESNTPPPIPTGDRPYSDSMAKLEGSLVHVFVNPPAQGGVSAFLNGVPVLGFESLSVEIVAPDDSQEGSISAALSRYQTPGTPPVGASVFPGTVEVVGMGKRISVTCSDPGSFDGLFLRLGVGDGGVGTETSGVSRFRLVVTPDIHDARLTWLEDGREDVLLT